MESNARQIKCEHIDFYRLFCELTIFSVIFRERTFKNITELVRQSYYLLREHNQWIQSWQHDETSILLFVLKSRFLIGTLK
jgi:hypothetical protein